MISSPTSSSRSSSSSRSASTTWRLRVEQRAHRLLGAVEHLLDLVARRRVVGQHPRHQPGVERAAAARLEADERAGHAERTDHHRRGRRRLREVAAGARPRLAEPDLLGDHPAEADLDVGEQLGTGPQEPLLGVASARAGPSEPRRRMIERTSSLRSDPDQVGDHRVPGLVGRDDPLLVLGVLDRVREPDLLGELRRLEIGPLHRLAPVAQRPRRAPRRRGARSSPASSRA